jgi:drug/metabolite transporter (DMT)-like permease
MEWSLIGYGAMILLIWYLSNAYCAIYTKEIVTKNQEWITIMDTTLAEFLMGIIWSGILILFRDEDLFPFTRADLTYQNIFGGVCHMMGSWLLCWSYNLMGAAITQVLKASDPIFTVLLTYLIDDKVCSAHTLLSLCYIVLGVLSCITGDFTINPLGLVVTMFSNIFMPLRTIFCKKMNNLKCSPYQSFLLTSLIAGISFLPLYLISYLILFFEYSFASSEHGHKYASPSTPSSTIVSPFTLYEYIYLLFFAGMLHAWYNLGAFCFLDLVTPVSYSVANLCKRIVSILMAMVFFHEKLTSKTILSLLVLFVGVGVYIASTLEGGVSSTIYYQHTLCVILICFLFLQ